MNPTKIEKDFDCLEFKQQAQEEISEDIKSLIPKEQIKYLRQKAESSSLGEWWKSIKNRLH
ncbi:hypothetical protein [Scytonema sp. NUACC26]|uniref:hypothetical protein n=1 Tax=Scytonema sp. NUACC26 TaxID=3140176 RepID=UPI0034DC18F6